MAITNPRDIPGLVAWYSAEAETGYADGAQLTQWTDLSGNGNHAVVQSTGGSLPVWKATDGATGGPAIRLTPGYFTLPALLVGAAAGEIMLALKVSAASGNGLWSFNLAGGSNDASYYPYAGVIYDNFGLASGQRQNFTPTLTLNTWRRYNVRSAAADWAASLDGVQQKSYTGGTVTWASAPLLGRNHAANGAHETFDGWMGAVVIFNRKLTTTERADLDAWMAANPSGGTLSTSATGTLSAVLPSLTANLAGGIEFSGTITAVLPALGANLSGTSTIAGIAGTITAILPPLGGSLAGAYSDTAILAAILPPLSANLTGTYAPPPVTGTLAANLPSLAANLAATAYEPGMSGTLDAVLPALSALLSGDVLGRNGFGLALDSTATLTVLEQVDTTTLPTPTGTPGVPATVLHIIAPTVPAPTLVNGRPQ